MEREFISYKQALALKELGFDESCFGFYSKIYGLMMVKTTGSSSLYKDAGECLAPTFSQAFRWFREKYGLNYVVVKAESWFYTINGCNTQEGFQTYEEAELACLDKLLEISEENGPKIIF